MVTPNLWIFLIVKKHPSPQKKGNSMTESSRFPKATAAMKKKQCEYFCFNGMCPLLYLLLQLLLSMVGFMATPPAALFVAALVLTVRLMSRHC
jgi:hypothetical protein